MTKSMPRPSGVGSGEAGLPGKDVDAVDAVALRDMRVGEDVACGNPKDATGDELPESGPAVPLTAIGLWSMNGRIAQHSQVRNE